VHQPLLAKKLDEVVESCVNGVGVELNTASAQLLSRVSGIGASLAKKIVKFREDNGRFGGRLKLLAIGSPKRHPKYPNVPTIAEAALPDYKYESWFGLLAPAGTPPAILAQVSRDVGQVLKTPDMIEKLTTFGSIPAPNSPEQFDAMIKSDTERYGKVLRDAGVAVN